MLVEIDNDTVLEMLMKRVMCWTDDETTIRLYAEMYEHYIDGGVFDGAEFNVNSIVDNDYVNWCDVVSEGDEYYDDIKRLYDEQGISDISCESVSHGYGYIEAEYNGSFLLRW